MNSKTKNEFKLNKNDVHVTFTRSSGPGGQNVNKVSSCVQMTHIPTGMQIKVQDTRDQVKNKEIAYARLESKLKTIEDKKNYEKNKSYRNNQIGEGGRGSKRRTYRILNGVVKDHITGKTCRWKDFSRGKIELLF